MTSTVDLRLGDCLEVMAGMPENGVDSVITDPPYGLSPLLAYHIQRVSHVTLLLLFRR